MTKADLKVGQVFKCKNRGLKEIVEITEINTKSIWEGMKFKLHHGGLYFSSLNDDGSISYPIDIFLEDYELINA